MKSNTHVVVVRNIAPRKAAVHARRVNLDGLATKLDAIAASVRTQPRPAIKEAAAEYQPPQRPSFQQQLAEMNRRNHEYWFGAKR
jgi:hypothetical protein